MNDYQNQLNRNQYSQLEQKLSEAMVKYLLRLCEENKSKERGAWSMGQGVWNLGSGASWRWF